MSLMMQHKLTDEEKGMTSTFTTINIQFFPSVANIAAQD